jgi:hypothetical protein
VARGARAGPEGRIEDTNTLYSAATDAATASALAREMHNTLCLSLPACPPARASSPATTGPEPSALTISPRPPSARSRSRAGRLFENTAAQRASGQRAHAPPVTALRAAANPTAPRVCTGGGTKSGGCLVEVAETLVGRGRKGLVDEEVHCRVLVRFGATDLVLRVRRGAALHGRVWKAKGAAEEPYPSIARRCT